jgi:hypothetical protein
MTLQIAPNRRELKSAGVDELIEADVISALLVRLWEVSPER